MRLTVYFPEESPTTHEFVGSKLTVGRLGENDVRLDEGSVSSHHAEIVIRDGRAALIDKDSTNGTFLNGVKVAGEVPLQEGDEIYFGSVRSVFMPAPPAAPAEVAAAESEAPADVAMGRPENFRYLSPFPRPAPPKDTLGLVAWVCAGLGLLAAAYALFVILA